ncbi:hypothetical protein [Cognatishimia activa]|nr:hypothetical protein [Cognatishimia activa]
MFDLDENTFQALKWAARQEHAALGDLVRIALNKDLVGRQMATNAISDPE